jgi:hypothetical protein
MERWTSAAHPLRPMLCAMISTSVAHVVQTEGRKAAAGLLRRVADAIESGGR